MNNQHKYNDIIEKYNENYFHKTVFSASNFVSIQIQLLSHCVNVISTKQTNEKKRENKKTLSSVTLLIPLEMNQAAEKIL